MQTLIAAGERGIAQQAATALRRDLKGRGLVRKIRGGEFPGARSLRRCGSRRHVARVHAAVLALLAMNAFRPDLQAVLQLADAESLAQQLAMELLAQPPDRRERMIRHLRKLYRDGIVMSGEPRDTAGHLGALLEARLRAQVADIEARGGGTAGTA